MRVRTVSLLLCCIVSLTALSWGNPEPRLVTLEENSEQLEVRVEAASDDPVSDKPESLVNKPDANAVEVVSSEPAPDKNEQLWHRVAKHVKYKKFLKRRRRKGIEVETNFLEQASGSDSRVDLTRVVVLAAEHFELDPTLVWAMVQVESEFKCKARSSSRAFGLMQIKQSTADWLGCQDVWDPEENILAGCRYMRMLIDQFGDEDTAIAAYNQGPGTISRSAEMPAAGAYYIGKVRKVQALLLKELKGEETSLTLPL